MVVHYFSLGVLLAITISFSKQGPTTGIKIKNSLLRSPSRNLGFPFHSCSALVTIHHFVEGKCYSTRRGVKQGISGILHTVLALNPASDMSSPCQRTAHAHKDVVPLDPGTIGEGTWLLNKRSGLDARVGAHTKEDKGDHSEKTGGHLGHDGSQNLGWRVFAFPVHVFGLSKEGGWGSNEGWLGSDLAGRHKCRNGKNIKRKDGKNKLGHG